MQQYTLATIALAAYRGWRKENIVSFKTGRRYRSSVPVDPVTVASGLTMKVVCLCTYRTRRTGRWTDADFAALKLIRALKGKPVSGWARVQVGPREWMRFDDGNRHVAFDIFGRLAATGLDWRSAGAVSLVPIPNSSCTVHTAQSPRTSALTHAVCRFVTCADLAVADVLRWSEPAGAAHEYSSRRYPEQLYPLLRLTQQPRTDRPVLLVDDMMTTGGHMRAAEAFLRAAGFSVLGGLCAGVSDDRMTTRETFAICIEQLESFFYEPGILDQPWEYQAPRSVPMTL